MKAFFTVTEDTLSRRMGQDLTLRFTLYIMCKFINGRESWRTTSKFLQYLVLISYQYDKYVLVMHADCVYMCGFFKSCCHTHVNKDHNAAGMLRVDSKTGL